MKKQKKQAAVQGEVCEETPDYDEEVDMAELEDEGSEELGSGADQARRLKVAKKPMKKVSKAQKGKRPKAKSEPKKPVKSSCFGAYEAGKYSSERDSFLGKLRKMGLSYQQANSQWMNSSRKKALLRDMPLPELKRRRFVGKDATSNPFGD